MRVLAACSLGGAGHLHPLLPFLAAARRRGDETLVIAPSALRAMVEGAGWPFREGGEPAESAVAPIRELLPVVPRAEASVLGNRELFGRLATAAMLPAMERACAEWAPDVIVREPCEYASAVVGPRLGAPTVQVAISLADVEWGAIETAAPALEEFRPGLAGELRAAPYLTRFPASLDPSPFPAATRYRASDARPGAPLPDWWNGADRPLVYVTFGTVLGHMTMAADVYRVVLRAVGALTARVLLTVGRRFDPADLGPVPGNVHVERWVDQDDVLPHADLVVCHGGSGTVLGALGIGVPLVLVPLFADQSENARRISGAGAGRTVVTCGGAETGSGRRPLHDDDAPMITEAVDAVLGDGRYRDRSRRLAAELGAAPAPDAVLDDVLAGPPPRPPGRGPGAA
jgi:UDP:flavonoid glycosyltransferase YjiC (YdhE family)